MKNRNILSILLTSICLIPFVSCSNKPSESAPSEELSSSNDSSQEQESSSLITPTQQPTSDEDSEPSISVTPTPVVAVELGEINQTYFKALKDGDNPYDIEVELIYSDDSIETIKVDESMLSEVDFSNEGRYRFNVTHEDISKSYEIFVYDEEQTITLDKSTSLNQLNSYTTGSYCSYTTNSIGFDFYRAYKNTGTDLTSILPQCDYVDVDSIGGCIYNTTPMYQISNISITYKTSGDELLLSVGKTRSEMEEMTLELSDNEYTTVNIDVDYDNYFKLEALSKTGYIKSLTITYLNANNTNSVGYIPTSGSRLNPVRFEGDLVSQQSSVTVPILVEEKDDSYEVIETKTYTYFAYEDVVKDPSLVELAAYVEPLDVANYFIAFGTYPANYVYKKQFDTAKATFGSYTRCVSDYSRTDGYARSVPCAFENGKPHYYECDIALEKSYSRSNRGVGRLVVWEYGFDAKGYDDAPVAVYTDDHYATFTEYLNNGSWGERFNAEMNVTAYIHGVLETLN